MSWEATSWGEMMTQPAPQEIDVAGRLLRPGSRVRLRPHQGGDLMDMALAGRVAVIEGIDCDDAGVAQVAVVVEDDPGRDLGLARHPAHRFFFQVSELEPVDEREEPARRVLVAGIGNIFHGDDGFGPAVAQRLLQRALPRGVDVVDFGIRGMDLAYALGSGYHAAVLVDALPRGSAPGTLCLVEPDLTEGDVAVDSHQMNPAAVLQLARALGPLPSRLLIVGCEPGPGGEPWSGEPMSMELSAEVAAAVDAAADTVADLTARLLEEAEPAG